MKITKLKLKQIIKEELSTLINEGDLPHFYTASRTKDTPVEVEINRSQFGETTEGQRPAFTATVSELGLWPVETWPPTSIVVNNDTEKTLASGGPKSYYIREDERQKWSGSEPVVWIYSQRHTVNNESGAPLEIVDI